MDSPNQRTDVNDCTPCRLGWRLPLFLAIVLLAMLAWRGGGIRQETPRVRGDQQSREISGDPAARPDVDREQVSLAIDFGDGPRDMGPLMWKPGMTVGDLLHEAEGLSIVEQGVGAGAFLTRLGDAANEGAGGRNWSYFVNGIRADRSFAIYELKPGDRVLWTFAPHE